MTDKKRCSVCPPPCPAGDGRRGVIAWRWAWGFASALGLCGVLVVGGCETSTVPTRAPGSTPAPTYTGPAYLRGTIGSVARLRPGTERAILVNGYGIVINLNGTGSTSAPPALRQAMINQMKKYGLGSARMNTQAMTPERVLADPNTAVVRIDGFIPPGAAPGLRFDVLVTAVDSQTTSLAGGTLWTATLGVNGAGQAFKFIHEQATAYGPIYDNPYHAGPSTGEPAEFGRQQSMIVAGGKTTAARDLELVLNQSSYTRSRAIADRINERFGKATDLKQLANPVSDQLIQIHVPPRYQNDPGGLVDLIMHLYLQTGPGFESGQARRLGQVLEERPEAEEPVTLAWQAMGRPVVGVLRESYRHPKMGNRLAALEAGAWLGDERASQSLSELAGDPDPAIRARVGRAMVSLPKSIKGARALKQLLNDEDATVRITAYESLATINDRLITSGRVVVADESGTKIKYVIDTVPSEKPLVYISQLGVPRIVIFNPELGFETPLLARVWDNRLMLSMEPGQGYLDVFYQRSLGSGRGGDANGGSVKFKAVADLKTLIYLLGQHPPPGEQANEGLGLTYSQVVDVVYQLCMRGEVDAPIEVRVSSLAKQIVDLENAQTPGARPETGPGVPGEESLIESSPDTQEALPLVVRPETGP